MLVAATKSHANMARNVVDLIVLIPYFPSYFFAALTANWSIRVIGHPSCNPSVGPMAAPWPRRRYKTSRMRLPAKKFLDVFLFSASLCATRRTDVLQVATGIDLIS
jgi:hypothetical protein